MRKKAIFNYNLATLLVRKGQKMVDIKPNYKAPGFYVYYFNLTPEAQEIIDNFYNKNS